MKTRRSGFKSGWLTRHSSRALATSGRSCSAARSDFFERELEKLKPVPQAADANLDPSLSRKPLLQLLKRRIGVGRYTSAKCIIVPRQLRFTSRTPQTRRHLTTRTHTANDFRHV